MPSPLPANVNLIQLLAGSPGTTIVGTEPLESVQNNTSVAFTLNQVLTFAQTNFSVGNLAPISGLSVLGVIGTANATPAAIAGTTDQVLRIAQNGTTLGFGAINLATGAAVTGLLANANGGLGTSTSPTIPGFVASPFFNATNTATGYQIAGTSIVRLAAPGFTELLSPAGDFGILVGSTDPNNYYYSGTHNFRDRAGVTRATLAMGPLISGGTTSLGLTLSTVANLGIFVGTGSPTLTAATSSIYFRNDGSSATTRIYVNKDGGSTWTALVASG